VIESFLFGEKKKKKKLWKGRMQLGGKDRRAAKNKAPKKGGKPESGSGKTHKGKKGEGGSEKFIGIE